VKRIGKISLISLLLFIFLGTPVLADVNRGQSDSTKQLADSEILGKTSSKSSAGVLIAQGTKPRQGFWQRMAFWKRKPQVKQKGKRQGFLQRFNRKQKPAKVKRNKRQGFLQRMNVKRFIPNFKSRRNKK
jgi:ribosomal protein L34